MKKIAFLFPLVALGFSGAGPTISQAERDAAISYMKETRESFLKDVRSLSAAQLSFKTGPDRWSVAQCIEHIAIAESVLMNAVQSNEKLPADPSRRGEIKVSDADVIKTVTDRSRRSTAPEFLQPANKFATTEEAVQTFIEQRKKNIEYVQTTNDDLRNHYLKHQLMGVVDDYQFILVLAAHSRRHTLQIEEVMADPNFPKN